MDVPDGHMGDVRERLEDAPRVPLREALAHLPHVEDMKKGLLGIMPRGPFFCF
jgi:hypothetical protein